MTAEALYPSDVELIALLEFQARFFRRHGAPDPEDLAGETLLRVLENFSRRLPIRNLRAFAQSIAVHVLSEDRRRRRRESTLQRSEVDWTSATRDEDERRARCLEECRRKCLTPRERFLLDQYYAGEGAERIARRARLAKQAGLTPNALRLRVFKIRERLARCVEECTKAQRRQPK